MYCTKVEPPRRGFRRRGQALSVKCSVQCDGAWWPWSASAWPPSPPRRPCTTTSRASSCPSSQCAGLPTHHWARPPRVRAATRAAAASPLFLQRTRRIAFSLFAFRSHILRKLSLGIVVSAAWRVARGTRRVAPRGARHGGAGRCPAAASACLGLPGPALPASPWPWPSRGSGSLT